MYIIIYYIISYSYYIVLYYIILHYIMLSLNSFGPQQIRTDPDHQSPTKSSSSVRNHLSEKGEEHPKCSTTFGTPNQQLLVGGWATPLKNMNVNWDDEIPNRWEKKTWQPNHQSTIG